MIQGEEKQSRLSDLRKRVDAVDLVKVHGRIRRVVGTLVYASVPTAHIGEICQLRTKGMQNPIEAEVVGIIENEVILTPLGEMWGISTETEVIPTGKSLSAPTGAGLLGRVLDGLGRPLDHGQHGVLDVQAYQPVNQSPPDPLQRKLIDTPFGSGVRVIDGLLTAGYGQRLGIFAAAGGGKSTLMSMLVLGADVDVCVVCLIGERGREVREFIEHQLGEKGLARSVLVVATSDRPPVERAKAAYVATSVAEFFRDQGLRVLLLMDSVTRFARAQREIGLAAGEPPTRRGFPPSVFAELPRLLERSGQSAKGSITAFYTVLVEGDDMNEPVSDEVRSILDGHIVLSQKLGARGHFPAVDVLNSTSRVMGQIVSANHLSAAGRIRALMAKYEEIELLLRIGEYQAGSDLLADQAIAKRDEIERFLRQDFRIPCPFNEALEELEEIAQ